MGMQDRKESKFKMLMNIKSKGVRLKKREVVRLGSLSPGQAFPLLVEPASRDVDLVEWAKGKAGFLESKLFEHGAILFKGFQVSSVAEFEAFAQAVCPALKGDYGDLPREKGGKSIYKSTPYPNEKTILFHSESSHLHSWPLKQFFCCLKKAQVGGETPIVDCRRILRLLQPETRERFRRKKLKYVRNFTSGLDVSWQEFFKTEDKAEVEERCRQDNVSFDWKEEGGFQTSQVCPAVARHPRTGDEVFFNQIQLHHPAFLDAEDRQAMESLFREEDFPRNVYYGDGAPIEESVIEEIRDVYREAAVIFEWEEGALVMVDNMLTAHARNPFQGERKVVVAMGEIVAVEDLQPVGEQV